MSAPFCKDCLHIRIGTTGMGYAKCALTGGAETDLVSGEPALVDYQYCSIQRMSGLTGCGPSGKNFRCKACDNLEGEYCSEECAKRAAEEYEWMADAIRNGNGPRTEEEIAQDLRDAGRGHLVAP